MKRKIYFDYMRVLATFTVIMLHVCAYRWYDVDIKTVNWLVIDFYNSLVRWCIPAFIMISGALFLGRNIQIKTIYSKYIFRIVVAFIFWTLLYALFSNENLMGKIKQILQGYYHMWFLFLIVGMYISIPVFSLIIRSEQLTKYYLIVSAIFAFVLPSLTQLANDFGSYEIQRGMESLNTDVSNMSIGSFVGYSFYYVLGYYLDNKELSKKSKNIIIVLGIIGMILTFLLSYITTQSIGVPQAGYYNSFRINILLYSVGAFVLLKNLFKSGFSHKVDYIIGKLSKYSFGIYLVHVLIIEKLELFIGITAISCNPLYFVPVLTIIIFILSALISMIINCLPVIKNYIV